MSRYDILTGKKPKFPKKKFMAVDTAKGEDVTAVSQIYGDSMVQRFLNHMSSPNRSMPYFSSRPLVKVPVEESLSMGEYVSTTSDGRISKLEPGRIPIGRVVDADPRDRTATVQFLSTDEQMGAAQRMSSEARDLNRTREYRQRMETLEILNRSNIQLSDVLDTTSADPLEPFKGPLHRHPNMEKQLNIPDDHVIVDKEEWERALRMTQHNPHEHPDMQQQLNVPENHVIIDKEEWERIRIDLNGDPDLLLPF